MDDFTQNILRETSQKIDRLCLEFLEEHPDTERMVTWVYPKGSTIEYGVGTYLPDEVPGWAVRRYKATPAARDEFLLTYEPAHGEPR